MKTSFAMLLCAAAVAGMLSGGCRNHIQDVDTTMTDYERATLRDVPLVEVLERDENNGLLRFKLTGNRESELKVFEVHNTIARYTPYAGWREFYEVPMGLVIFPVGMCSHLLNVFSFGIFPYRWCWAMDCYGLAALNPIMNTESDSRFDEEPLVSRRELVDTRGENTAYIMHQTDVALQAGSAAQHLLTDPTGVAQFELIDLQGRGVTIDSGEREVVLFVAGSTEPSYRWIVPRALQIRLTAACKALQLYRDNPSGASLAQCVNRLEELKFTKLSYQLEHAELKAHAQDSKFRHDFNAANEAAQ